MFRFNKQLLTVMGVANSCIHAVMLTLSSAAAGDTLNMVTFDLSKEGAGSSVVEQANVWIFLKVSKGNRAKGKVMLRLLRFNDNEEEEECVSEKMVDTRRSGWHTLGVSRSIQTLLDSGGSSVSMQVSCLLCTEAGASPVLVPANAERAGERDQSHRPFLMVVLRAREEETLQRVKRGLECGWVTSPLWCLCMCAKEE